MSLIDANTLPRTKIVERRQVLKNGRLTMEHVATEVIRVEDLEKAQTVDAVEVVRCKECAVPHNKWLGCPNLNGMIPPPDFYCARGEMRSGDE